MQEVEKSELHCLVNPIPTKYANARCQAELDVIDQGKLEQTNVNILESKLHRHEKIRQKNCLPNEARLSHTTTDNQSTIV